MSRTTRFGLQCLGVCVAVAMAYPSASAEEIKFGRITKAGTHPYFTAETEGMREAAKELGIELLYQDVQTDADQTVTAMDTMVTAGVKAIAVTVPDQRVGPAVIAKAKEAGILLIAPYDPISDAEGNPAPFISGSSPEMGRMAGEVAAKLYEELGWAANKDLVIRIAAMEIQPVEPCMERSNSATETFLKLVPDFGADKVLHVAVHPQTVENAITAMATVATANPNVTNWLIWGCDDTEVVGAIRGLEQAGYKGDSIVAVGQSGSFACEEWASPVETGHRATIFQDAKANGRAVINVLYEAYKSGKPLPAVTPLPLFPQTRDNHPMCDKK